MNRAVSSGVQPEELLLASFSRYQWMDDLNGSKNRDLFQYLTREGSGYLSVSYTHLTKSQTDIST